MDSDPKTLECYGKCVNGKNADCPRTMDSDPKT
ncbi:hypothetical protein ISN45_At04g002740 [Arabidopsis thaliana x Arabidopsis arenosa]|uniref:Uncharacterized protein n=1 Tax=Arabidopsis thaliana x Arabidopsis arenosa TaxID=1240361 RepID=A0A8T2DVL3_9BRAS|nr:hypothetical protein ISN45_At04g002740 [Arabidopsis thaliana x Arabidopsis arenosa]